MQHTITFYENEIFEALRESAKKSGIETHDAAQMSLPPLTELDSGREPYIQIIM